MFSVFFIRVPYVVQQDCELFESRDSVLMKAWYKSWVQRKSDHVSESALVTVDL